MLQQYWAMSPGTKEQIDRIQPKRVSRLGRQIATLDMPYQGQGQDQVRSGHQRSSQTTCSMGYVRHMIHGSFYSYNTKVRLKK